MTALENVASFCFNPFPRDIMCVGRDLLLVLKLGCPHNLAVSNTQSFQLKCSILKWIKSRNNLRAEILLNIVSNFILFLF